MIRLNISNLRLARGAQWTVFMHQCKSTSPWPQIKKVHLASKRVCLPLLPPPPTWDEKCGFACSVHLCWTFRSKTRKFLKRVHVCVLSRFSHVQLFTTPRTVTCQAPLSMDFSRQEYWSGWLCSPSGNLPNPGIEPRSPTLQADSLMPEPPGKPGLIFLI